MPLSYSNAVTDADIALLVEDYEAGNREESRRLAMAALPGADRDVALALTVADAAFVDRAAFLRAERARIIAEIDKVEAERAAYSDLMDSVRTRVGRGLITDGVIDALQDLAGWLVEAGQADLARRVSAIVDLNAATPANEVAS